MKSSTDSLTPPVLNVFTVSLRIQLCNEFSICSLFFFRWEHFRGLFMKRRRFYGVTCKKSPPNASQTEERRTFFVSSKEFQLLLLLPPQRVDDGDGQSERFLRVAVGPQCVHPGTRCGDVLCRAGGEKENCKVRPDFSVFQAGPPRCLTVPQRAPSGVEEGAVVVVIVTVVGVVVLGDDVLQVGVLPVQVAGLDGPCEHRPVRPRQRICERDKKHKRARKKERKIKWLQTKKKKTKTAVVIYHLQICWK